MHRLRVAISRPRITSVLVLSVLVFGLGSCGGGVSPESIAQAAALQSAIHTISSELRDLANDMLAAGDQVLANRTDQAANEIELLLPQLDGVLTGVETHANRVIDNASRTLTGTLADLRADGGKVGSYASSRLNISLAVLTQTIDGLPLLKVDPVIFAISPTRISVNDGARTIRVFGFLPGQIGDDVLVSIDGNSVTPTRGAGNSLVFKLPVGLKLTEEAEIPILLTVHRRSGLFGFFRKTFTITDGIVVGKSEPFVCKIEQFAENPKYLEAVKAPKAATYEATTQGGQNRPNENRKVLAKDLFTSLLADGATSYNLDTVAFKDAGVKFTSYGECGGRGPSGNAKLTDSNKSLEINIVAPHLGNYTTGSLFHRRYCHAGGTKGLMTLTPTFTVAKTSSPYLVSESIDSFRMGSRGVERTVALPSGKPWALHVKCDFKERSESWSTRTLVLTETDEEEIARGVVARVAQNRLLVDPLDPIRFDDELED